MRVEWDENRCELALVCTALAPDVFELNDQGHLQISGDYGDAQRSQLQDAADSCPTRAITLVH